MYACNQKMTVTMCFKILFIMDIISKDKGLEKKFETVILLGNKITTHNQNHALNKDLSYEKPLQISNFNTIKCIQSCV